ncbi:MAG: MOSC domain-containing protein [Acidimicrobiales bacterium]|jgi:MOSC domain-containing protein YiiM
MAIVESVNVGVLRSIGAKAGATGIDKVPTTATVMVSAPGPGGAGKGGLAGDVICDAEHHGGDDQAVYAYSREDLAWWETELGRALRGGMFGENLTTLGLDVTEALIGETWRIGESVVLQVRSPRVPCGTFAAWIDQKGWLKAFTRQARPGAYLRVLEQGEIKAGDPIVVVFRPSHSATVGVTFRALTLEPDLCRKVLEASEFLSDEIVRRAERRDVFVLYDPAEV